MPGAPGGGYLPPVVASLEAEAGDLIRVVQEAKALLADYAEQDTTTELRADSAPLVAGLAEARAAADAFSAKPITLRVTVDLASAMAAFAALRVAEAASAMGAGGEGGGGGAAAAAAAGGAAGGRGGAGLLATLGWGGGMFGMAGIGSILSLAGFGFEHVITTALGLIGSAIGGMLGGGLLGAGAGGVMAVGGGADMLAMGTTRANVTALGAAYEQLRADTLLYGASSKQVAADQAVINQQLAAGGNAGRQAALGVAIAQNALVNYWQQASSGAQVMAANIMQQVLGLAHTYVPLVAAAAQQNLTIINTSLKPLFTWLEGPQGIGIFQHLEGLFASTLPTAMDAFTQGVELILKTINVAAGYTGHFIVTLDDFLRRMNSPAGFAKWQIEIGKLIGLFRDWERLIVVAVQDTALFFKSSAGLGTSIVTTLTQMLDRLHAWLQSTSGQQSLGNLFRVHLQEIQAILALLPQMIGTFAKLYLAVAPQLTILATGLLTIVNALLNIPGVGPILAWGIAIGILAKQMQLLTFLSWIAGLAKFGQAFLVFAGEEGIAAAATAAFDGVLAVLDALLSPFLLIAAAVAVLGVGLFLLVTHFKAVSNFLHGPLGTAISAAVAAFAPLIGIPMLIIGHWQQIGTFFHDLPGRILDFLKPLPGRILDFFKGVPGGMVTGLTRGLPALLGWFGGLADNVLHALGNAGLWLVKTGVSVLGGLLSGIGHAAVDLWNWFTSLPGKIVHLLAGLPGLLVGAGVGLVTGLWHGITTGWAGIGSWLGGLGGSILRMIGDLGNLLFNIGKSIITGFLHGLQSAWNAVTGFIGGIASWISQHKGPIEADAVLLVPHGKAVMTGFHQGLLSEWGNVQRSIGGMNTSLAGAMPGAGGRVGYGRTGTTIAIDARIMNPQLNGTPQQMLAQMQTMVQQNQQKFAQELRRITGG